MFNKTNASVGLLDASVGLLDASVGLLDASLISIFLKNVSILVCCRKGNAFIPSF